MIDKTWDESRRAFLAAAAATTGSLVAPRTSAAGVNRPIRIGQIGTAHAHADGKMATMRKFPELFEVVGVAEPDPERRRSLDQRAAYRGVPVLSEQQLLNQPDLQAVAVETAVEQLVPTAQRCVEANLHVHLDKPAGDDLPAFATLLALAERKQRTIQMGYMYRYNPAFRLLYQAVHDGWLGDVFEAHGVMSKLVNDATRRQLARFPGGSMFELGCHLIDSLVYTLGPPQRVTPYTRHTRSDGLADNQLAVFECGSATATIRSALVEVEGQRRRQMVVCGTAGTLTIRPLEPPAVTLTLRAAQGPYKKGQQTVKLKRLSGRYDGDFLDLARVIRGEKELEFTPQHDLAVQRAVLDASSVDHRGRPKKAGA